MRVAIRVPGFAPVPEIVRFTQRCEEAGFDGVGFVDSQMITRDVVATIAAAAVVTNRVTLSTAVTNPVTRHSSVWASAAQSLDELAPGRIEVWIGRGYSSLHLIGVPQAGVKFFANWIREMRRLMADEWDVYEGAHTHLNGSGRVVPIRVAAAGPQVLRLAGALGDSVLISVGNNLPAIERARQYVHEGAIAAGRRPEDVPIALSLYTSIRPDREEAYRWASPLCARNLGNANWLKDAGVDGRGLAPPAGLNDLYPDLFHAEDWDRAMALSDYIPRDLLREMAPHVGLVGSPDDCVEELRKLSALGFREVFMQTIGTFNFPEAEVRAFEETIAPAIASLP